MSNAFYAISRIFRYKEKKVGIMILTVTVIVIVSLPEHAFATPCIGPQISTCDCRGTIVDCESGLTAIPGGVPSSTTFL